MLTLPRDGKQILSPAWSRLRKLDGFGPILWIDPDHKDSLSCLMDLRQLRYFVAVARELHFGRAAERLHVAQPAVSQQLRALETKLGTRVFNRGPHGVSLTDAGRALFSEAPELLDRAERLKALVRAVGQGLRGILRINYLSSSPIGLGAEIIERLRQRFPDITLQMNSNTTAVNLAEVSRGDIDAAFVRPPVEGASLGSLVVGHDKLVVAIPGRHRLARVRRVSKAFVRKEAIISWPREHGPGLHDAIQTEVFGETVPKVVRVEPNSEQMVRAVARGLGLAVITDSRASTLNLPGVAIRRFHSPEPKAPLALVWRRNDHSATVARLVQVACELSIGATAQEK